MTVPRKMLCEIRQPVVYPLDLTPET